MSWFERSFVGKALNMAGGVPVRLLRRAADGKFRTPGGLQPHQWYLAAGVGLMLCVPHEYWNNLYGVLFAMTGLILYWWDCAAGRTDPMEPTALGAWVWLFLLLCVLSPLWSAFPADGARVAVFILTGFVLCYLTAAAAVDRKAAGVFYDFVFAALIVVAAAGCGDAGQNGVSGEDDSLQKVLDAGQKSEPVIERVRHLGLAAVEALLRCARHASLVMQKDDQLGAELFGQRHEGFDA